MADKKISQLTAATTPLAGTEVLPIVQSSTTRKVSVNDLTAGKTVNADTFIAGTDPSSTGNLRVGGGAWIGGYLRFAADNTHDIGEAANGRPKDIYLGGNIIPAANKGVDFSNNASAAGMTSELLNDYEEGTWTPAYGTTGTQFDSVTYAAATGGKYVKIGKQVFVQGSIRTDAITVGSASGNIVITGIPFAVPVNTGSTADGNAAISAFLSLGFTSNPPLFGLFTAGTSRITLYSSITGGQPSVADMATGASANTFRFSGSYITS